MKYRGFLIIGCVALALTGALSAATPRAAQSGQPDTSGLSGTITASGAPIEGKLSFFDNTVDPTTDTIKLKASFPNRDVRLWPGQFTRVTLRLAILSKATVIPSQAVQTGQDGQFVFLVTPESTVDQRPITVAQRMGEEVVVGSGLAPGDTVVTEGQLRLEQGTRVQVQAPGGADTGRANGGSGGRGGRGGGGRASRGQNGQAQQGRQ